MKKMISCLAALALLAAMPAASAFAAETAPASASAEAAYDETDIRNLAGQWKYQVAPEGMNITAGMTDNGIVTVKEDGTYTYTDLEGNTHSGTVKLDYDTFGEEYKVPFFAFYEGDRFFIGCYCQQNNPNAFIIGNGGTAQLLSVDADFSAIEGEWEAADVDGRVFNIYQNGAYTVTYTDDSTENGFITIGSKMFAEDDGGKWYNFYNESGMAWIGFPVTENKTVNELKAGDFTLRRKTNKYGDPLNQYGFYEPAEYPAAGLSTAALIGTWNDAANTEAVLTITEGRSFYNSKFEYINGTETVRGFIDLEYLIDTEGSKEYRYNFYNIDGTFWYSFKADGNVPLNDIYSGNDEEIHFLRQEDEKNADKSEIAAARLNDLNTINGILFASPVYTAEDNAIKEYVKVTDERFTSVSAFKNFIKQTCTESLQEDLLNSCDECLMEKNGSLYAKKAGMSYIIFATEADINVTDPAMNRFRVYTNHNDALYGPATAAFFFDDGRWKISSYSSGIYVDTASDKEDKTEGAIRVMKNFNVIMALTGASPAYTADDGKVNGYVKVTDSRFTSIADLYAFVADNFTGEAKEVFNRYIDGYFIEKDGSLYVQFIPRSFYQFHTENGVTIKNPAMDYCTAIANKGDELFGVGKALLKCENGKWHIESYEFGDFYGAEMHDVSEISGTWDEVDTLYPRTLIIRDDGSFNLIFIDGRLMYGTVKVEDIGYPNGSMQTWFNLYDENNEFYTGFEATSQTPLNDLYTGQDGSQHFVRYIEPEHKYSTDELQKMAAKDYEEKTGIRPAETHSMTNVGGSVTVVFTDKNGEDFDAYTVDPDTGIGEKFSDGSAVNLPQTGNNSLAMAGALAGASALTLLGVGAVIKSGKLRKKEDEE